MGNHNRLKRFHAQGSPLHVSFVQKTGGYNHSRGYTFLLQANGVVRTARGTRASITDGSNDRLAFQGDLFD